MIGQERSEWLDDVVARIGLEQAYLFGGAAFDWSSQSPGVANDVDLQATGGTLAEERLLRAVERDRGAAFLSGPRDYWIFHTVPVRLFEVRIDGAMLDVNLMDTAIRPGHFSIETVRWNIADRTIEDPHSALGDLNSVRLVTGIDSDNPIRMLARLIRLAKKYSLSLQADTHLLDTAVALRDRAHRWRPESRFHGMDAWDSYGRLISRISQFAPRDDPLLEELANLGLSDLRERCSGPACGGSRGDNRYV